MPLFQRPFYLLVGFLPQLPARVRRFFIDQPVGFPPPYLFGLRGFFIDSRGWFFPLLPSFYRKKVFSNACRSCHSCRFCHFYCSCHSCHSCRSSRRLLEKSSFHSSLHNFQSIYYHLHTWRSSRREKKAIVMSWHETAARIGAATSTWHLLHLVTTRCTRTSAIIHPLSFNRYYSSAIIHPLSLSAIFYQRYEYNDDLSERSPVIIKTQSLFAVWWQRCGCRRWQLEQRVVI